MATPELTYLMRIAPKLDQTTLGNILSTAAERTDGSEKERLWYAASWKHILSAAAHLSTGLIKANVEYTKTKFQQSSWSDLFSGAISSTKFLASTGWNLGKNIKRDTFSKAENFINTIVNDPDFPRFLSENQDLVTCILKNSLETPNETTQLKKPHPSRTIDSFVATLPELIRQLQKRQLLKDVTDLNSMVTRTIETLVEDAANLSNNPAQHNLYSSALEVSTQFLNMAAAHPEAAKNIIGRLITTTESPATQGELVKALTSLTLSDTTTVGPDGKKRKDLAVACNRYREQPNPKQRMLLDSPTEYLMHTHNCSHLELTPSLIPEGTHIEGFNFKNTYVEKGFPADGSCFVKCDFNFAFFDEHSNFKGAVIDASTFRTMVPSLRVAKAENREVKLDGLKIIGNIDFDVSHIDLTGVSCTKIAKKFASPDVPLTSMEVAIRRAADKFHQQVNETIEEKQTKFSKQKPEFLDKMFFHISKLKDLEQNIVLDALEHDHKTLNNFVSLIEQNTDLDQAITSEINTIKATPELTRQFLRRASSTNLDPFTNEILSLLPSLSDTQHEVLQTILQENTEILSKTYDTLEGKPRAKAMLLLQHIETDPQFKFRKQINEYKRPKEVFTTQHIESLNRLFIEIGCGPFVDTVEYDPAKHPPQPFGSIFQKTLCFLFPNTRHLFGRNTKFGQTLASRSFLQMCKLIIYSIRHPQKMWRTIKDAAYAMDQIGWITWKEKRDINKATLELVSKLVTGGTVGDFINNPRLPELAFATTKLFPNPKDAEQSIAVAKQFFSALQDSGVVKNFDQLVKGPHAQRAHIIAPFLGKIVENKLLNNMNQGTALFLANTLNVALNASEKNKILPEEILSLVNSGKKAAEILKKYGMVDNIEKLLLAPAPEKIDILKKTIHDPKDFSQILTSINELQKDMNPLIEKAALLWNTHTVPDEKGIILWYAPDQTKLDKAFAEAKATDTQATVNLNQTFNACSFGHSTLIGSEEQPINWTNVRANKFDMWGTTLKHVILDGSQLSGYSNPVISKWYFRGASFDHANFEHCSLNDVTIQNAYMPDVTLENCQANNLDLTSANIMYGTLNECQLSKPKFAYSTLYGSYIKNCTITDGDFSKTKSEYAVFQNTLFKGITNFNNANLENTNFNGATFTGQVNMCGAVLINAKLDQITLDKNTKLDISEAFLTDTQLKYLQKTFPENIQNPEKAIVVKANTIKNFGYVDQTQKPSSAVEALTAERAKKMLQGRFSDRNRS